MVFGICLPTSVLNALIHFLMLLRAMDLLSISRTLQSRKHSRVDHIMATNRLWNVFMIILQSLLKTMLRIDQFWKQIYTEPDFHFSTWRG